MMRKGLPTRATLLQQAGALSFITLIFFS